jgi:transcriptional regulator with XRE-family HTH domain
MIKRGSDPIDKHVGTRIRMRRQMISMSQEKLAKKLGITFQQVQKYEKGTNRVGASRLQAIASILGAPIAFFFEGSLGADKMDDGPISDLLSDLLATKAGPALVKAFVKVRDPAIRRQIVHLVEAIASGSVAKK